MDSATDLISDALHRLGVLEPGELPAPEDLVLCKRLLDTFVDALGAERGTIFSVVRHVHALTANVGTYTIGVGGDFNQAWPSWVDGASIIPNRTSSPVMELPIGRPLTLAEFQAIPILATTGSYPTSFYFDQAFASGLGTITVYPVPTTSVCDLVLWTPSAVASFSDLTTQYTFPPGYGRMFAYNLPLEFAEAFDAQPSARIQQEAARSMAVIKRANVRHTDMRMDPAMPGLRGGGRYNLYVGE